MIYLITGVPGSGKTQLMVSLIQSYLDEGRPVYHNIEGLVLDKFDNNHLIFDAPPDWRETPDGSVLIYDECQQDHLYPATAQRGLVADPRLTAMETHRHTGHDLYFITQAPTFVHHHIRKLVGQHIHLYRGGGATSVAKYTWSHTCDSPNDRNEQERADFSIFRFDKKHQDKYQSSTVHTHKFKIPVKIIVLFTFIFILVSLIVYQFFNSSILSIAFGRDSPTIEQPAQLLASAAVAKPTPTTSPRAWLDDVPVTRSVSGCISSAKSCQCYTQDLMPLDMAQDQCRAFIKSPLPIRLHEVSKSSSS